MVTDMREKVAVVTDSREKVAVCDRQQREGGWW